MSWHRRSIPRDQALAIWQSAVAGVDPQRLVANAIEVHGASLRVGETTWSGRAESRICVVGGGKAGAAMARGLENALSKCWLEKTSGWLNVPEAPGGEPVPTQRIHLHPARPAGINEPTGAGVQGTQQMLKLVRSCTQDDLCIVLLSGGGSALMPAPRAGISLDDKLQVTRLLSRGGANIQQLNTVRRALSEIKGGGLLRACRAGTLVTLVISDVCGDPLEIIASGPTIQPPAGLQERPEQLAIAVLKDVLGSDAERVVPPAVWQVLHAPVSDEPERAVALPRHSVHVIGNNQTAVTAAARAASEQGYRVVDQVADQAGEAAVLGRELAELGLKLRRDHREPVCLISGGEPIVHVRPSTGSQLGGRNQELALAAIARWWDEPDISGLTLLSAGTDGEDGPTDAAGGFADELAIEVAQQQRLSPEEFLERHDSYHFLQAAESLVVTGPTGTNVMDLRILLCQPA